MGSERPDKKKEKKEKKLQDGGVKKEKKDKKDKKDKKAKLAAALDEHLQGEGPAAVVPAVEESGAMAVDEVATPKKKGAEVVPAGAAALVEFAVPIADEKNSKKVLKGVRKAAKNNSLKRGVKEVVKTLRKSPASSPTNRSFPGVVVIAADISPADVISHLPVLCEDHNVPYIFVTSRAELGAAAKTKRPTSVVMIMEKGDVKRKKEEKKGDDEGEDDGEKWEEAYQGLVKLIQKETERQSFW